MAPSQMSNVSSGLQEILFAQRLADNDKKTRDRALKKLNKYLAIKSSSGAGFTFEDLIKIWKGLFYCMYMADKPLVQEEVAEKISRLILSVGNVEDRRSFCQAALATFAREWDGIDTFRIDKFMMFVRRVMRQVFVHLKEMKWSLDEVVALSKIFEETVLVPTDNINSLPLGLKLHFCDVFLEEVAKIGGEELDDSVILGLLQPFIKVLAMSNLKSYRERVIERIFRHLMRQSDLGIQHQEGLVEDEFMVDIEEGDDLEEPEEVNQHQNDKETCLEEDGALDPRAGEVDVFLPQLKPNFNTIADTLLAAGSIKGVMSVNRNELYRLAQEFRDIAAGIYPLQMPKDDDEEDDDVLQEEIKKAMTRIQKYEERIKKKIFGQKRKREDDDHVDGGESKKSRLNEIRKANQKKKKKKRKKIKTGPSEDKPRPKIKSESKMKEEVRLQVEDKLKEVLSNVGVPVSSSVEKENVILGTPVDFPGRRRKRRKVTPFEVTDLPPVKVEDNAGTESSELAPSGQNEKKAVEFSESRKDTILGGNDEMQTVKHSEVKKQKVSESEGMKNCVGATSSSPHKKKKKKNKNKDKFPKGMQEINKVLPDAGDVGPTETPTAEESTPKATAASAASIGTSDSCSVTHDIALQMNYSEVEEKKVVSADPWSAPIQEGEYEVFIKSKKEKRKRKKKMLEFFKKTPDSNKKIKINLKNNQEHDYKDYARTVRLSPKIPFSAEKKPKSSLLKASPSPVMVRKSPVNKLKSLATSPKFKVKSASPKLKVASASPEQGLSVLKRSRASDFF